MLWKIHFRGSSRHLLLPVEFQSATERYMSARALCHIALAYNALISAKGRRRKLAPGGMLPPTLAVTIYNGRERWAAPDDIFDLIEPVRGWLAGRQPRLQHQVLDLQTLARQPQTMGAGSGRVVGNRRRGTGRCTDGRAAGQTVGRHHRPGGNRPHR